MKQPMPYLRGGSPPSEIAEAAHLLYQHAVSIARSKGLPILETAYGTGYMLPHNGAELADQVWESHRTGRAKTSWNNIREFLNVSGAMRTTKDRRHETFVAAEWDVPDPVAVMDRVREIRVERKHRWDKKKEAREGIERMRIDPELQPREGVAANVDELLREVEQDEANPPPPRPHNIIPNTLTHADGEHECTVCGHVTKQGSGAASHQRSHQNQSLEEQLHQARAELSAAYRILHEDGLPPDTWTNVQGYVAWLEEQLIATTEAVSELAEPPGVTEADVKLTMIQDIMDAFGRGEKTMIETLKAIRGLLSNAGA